MGKKLKDILYKVPVTEIHGSTDIVVQDLCIDSRLAVAGSMFIARKGTALDAHQFIPALADEGVAAVLCEDLPPALKDDVTYIRTANSDHALGILASNFYDKPSENLILCGVTGTNGKTSVASLLYQLFTKLGYGAGLISTVKNMIDQREVSATHTTPDAISINALLKEMADAGCTYCFMEVSSHAIHQQRISGLNFTGGIFTNITHDHLDYHGDFKEYLNAKKAFFDGLPSHAFALTNADDTNG
ncbi:MAG: UDP-N-acetylmuramoyl-L-alanyl-D-glutamate--2,6-diaminopimelate ligase, partial [Bacteroidetes bacterium]